MRFIRRVVFLVVCAASFNALPAAAAQNDAVSICSTNSFVMYDDISGIWSPCATPRGSLLAETTYLQNASAVGGTALAAYPMLTLRTGVAPNVEFVFDSPSQIAESGLRGIGLYPRSHLGYGFRYTAAQTERMAFAIVTEVQPPAFRFSPNHTQSRYVLGFTSEYALNGKLSLGLSELGTAAGKAGVVRIAPSSALTANYMMSGSMQLSTDFGSRMQGRQNSAQSFGDIAVSETLRKKLSVKLGIGTTFNPSSGTKPHYLAGGFNYRL